MCNFNKLNDQEKQNLHTLLTQAAQNIGGINFLLALEEAMRGKKPHALMQKEMQVASNNTIIRWNKIVFKDKVELIENLLRTMKESDTQNILEEENPKKRKNIVNMTRTLAPLEFKVTPQNPNDGEGFTFKAFETLEDDKALFHPLFLALFFCSTEFSKKALKHD